MASVSITFSPDDPGGHDRVGRQVIKRGTVTMSGTYTSTKVPVTAGDFGLTDIDQLYVTGAVTANDEATATYLQAVYVPASDYIILEEDGREVAATFDTNAGSFHVEVRGRG